MEIDDVTALRELLDRGASLAGARLENLDLDAVAAPLLARSDLTGLVVLGGRVSPDLAAHLTRAGAVVFPTDPAAPVDVYRSRLYSPAELYAGLDEGYESTPDKRAYDWTLDAEAGDDHYVAVLRALHDDSLVDALDDALAGLRAAEVPVVGVMGGHALGRGTEGYAQAAWLGRALARSGRTVLTGGGPGAMEAANLGALSAGADEATLDAALAVVAGTPSFRPSIADWARAGLQARALLTGSDGRAEGGQAPPRSIGIPTWFYGHEPPNVFCDGIAKLFSNAVREDVLLDRCTGGVVVLPGAAGTVQEIFQTTTRLYYAPEGPLPPLVLVGRREWTQDVPVWPLLQALGRGRLMADAVHLVDDVEQAARLVVASGTRTPPPPHR